ncbi:Electron transfer flavoprotein alpha/beta-subunit [Solidesulfovibrio carbinoliphilus subsp. oakridgensis]|uniref:Electron transfer flavoprotein alpha/beta-subunit n=1 Tax=Solidesulfovibrio carbinoliphilus subsp. oakridgensis TaxID=694327 RepID=G7QAZ9_9BACT|nr:electron transfer flavoprotein subunit alpha [Solidesulfovibrio carbinoliphilus]EHJ48340.1 Electron transfer flavoprotein alpha/beta-subunit [Solidesulfovibrio carbinoliphilus subsp. oakridgensis]
MDTIVFLAHTEADGSLAKASLEALTAAKTLAGGLGATLSIGLFGADVAAAANAVAGCDASAIHGVSGEAFGQPRYASDVAAMEALVKAANATIVVAADDSRMSRALPGVAARLGGRIDAHVTGLAARDGQAVATRGYYRQRMQAELTRTARPWCLTVSAGVFAACDGPSGQAAVTPVDVPVTEALTRTTVKTVIAPAADEQTIRPDARLLFVAGAGWTKKQADGVPHVADAADLILGFVGKAAASLGSSKSLVDMGGEGEAVLPFLSHLHQVGQTGATPRHPKGLATCCHGEEPHVVGWRFIGERRAVNLDPACGWAQGKADVLYVADAFAVMKKINELLG